MPNIRTFEAPNLGIQPSETGVQATAQAANRIGRFYDQAASATATVGRETAAVGESFARGLGAGVSAIGVQVVKYAEHREISHGAAAYAELNDNLTQAWNKTAQTADPNDPSVAQKFRETQLEPALEKYRDAFMTEGGQKFAEARIESIRNHMFEKTSADMASLAAAAVSVNMRTTSNNLSNTALSDPSSVPHLLDSADGLVGDMVSSSPNLKGAVAAKARMELTQKMKEGIVKAGAIGAIMKSGNPEATAQEWGSKYPDYINGEEMKMLAANARQQIRAARTDAAYVDHLKKIDAQDKSDQAETGYLQKLYSDDPKVQSEVSTKAIVNDPTLNRQAKERMINVVNREMKPETAAQESATNTAQLLDRIRLPDGDPNRISDLNPIYDAYINGKISKSDFAFARKEFSDARTPEGQRLGETKAYLIKAVSGSITKSNPLQGKIDPSGDMMKYRFEQDLNAKIDEYRKSGKNPYDLFDPSKPDFVGRPENVARYQVPLNQSVKNATQRLRGGSMNLTGPNSTITGIEVKPAPKVEPRKQGESAADYLKRIGK